MWIHKKFMLKQSFHLNKNVLPLIHIQWGPLEQYNSYLSSAL